MGGGLFGTPLALNPKCLVFSAFVLAVYWMPHAKFFEHKVVIAFLLATTAYVLLAWYDVLYDCNDHLKPTILGWLSMPFKPAEYRKGYENLPLKYKKIVQYTDIAILIIMVFLVFSPYVLYSRK
jgi:UDP-N-acetylmuramyl pentapeptide phosphotransferase/UDP-N-acetylglucosamine-1-phosphate transferase